MYSMSDEQARKTIIEYGWTHDIEGFDAIIKEMAFQYYDLDDADRTAFKRYNKNPKMFDTSSDR